MIDFVDEHWRHPCHCCGAHDRRPDADAAAALALALVATLRRLRQSSGAACYLRSTRRRRWWQLWNYRRRGGARSSWAWLLWGSGCGWMPASCGHGQVSTHNLLANFVDGQTIIRWTLSAKSSAATMATRASAKGRQKISSPSSTAVSADTVIIHDKRKTTSVSGIQQSRWHQWHQWYIKWNHSRHCLRNYIQQRNNSQAHQKHK